MSHKDGADHINVPDPLSEVTPLPSNPKSPDEWSLEDARKYAAEARERGHNPEDQCNSGWLVRLHAEIERLTRRVAELQQFHDWAEPQIHDHGRDVLTIERLTRERDEAREAYTDENLHKHGLIGKYGRLRAALAELLACKALREKIDGELSACHQEMSPQLQALENEYQLRKPLAWRDARAALSGEPTSAVETSGQLRASEWARENNAAVTDQWMQGWDACLVANRIPLTTRIELPAPFVVYRSCAKHLSIPWTLSATYTAPPEEVCPICEPPEKAGEKS